MLCFVTNFKIQIIPWLGQPDSCQAKLPCCINTHLVGGPPVWSITGCWRTMDHLHTIVKTPCEVSPCRHHCAGQYCHLVVACQINFINNVCNLMLSWSWSTVIINYQSSPGKMTIPCKITIKHLPDSQARQMSSHMETSPWTGTLTLTWSMLVVGKRQRGVDIWHYVTRH